MVTTLTLPSSALGFTLDSNNQYIISVTLVMREILELIKDIDINSYLRHHVPKYKYTFYINGTAWKSSDYIELTNTNVNIDENISDYLNSNMKQTLSCTVEVSHPQFYYRLESENYTFIVINKKPQQLKALNSSTGEYETIGLSFSNLSSSEKSGIDNVRWPLFNTENSSQQFVIPIGSASYTRRNGSIRAERFGGSAGQYFNFDTNPNSNKDYRATNGTEYKYMSDFSPILKYETSYTWEKQHYCMTNSSYEWENPTTVAPPTLTTGENTVGRYISYAFGGWSNLADFRIDYFTDARIYAPNKYGKNLSIPKSPNYENLPNSAFGLRYFTTSSREYWAEVLGRDFTVSYTDAEKYVGYTEWPNYESFVTGGSVTLSGTGRYGSNWVLDRFDFIKGKKDYYYCVNRNYNERDREEYYHTSYLQPYIGFSPSGTELRYYIEFQTGVILRYYYVGENYHDVPTNERYYLPYGAEAVKYRTERYSVYSYDQTGFSFYEKFLVEYEHPLISYDWYLYTTYTTKSSTIAGELHGIEYKCEKYWVYEFRHNWYIDYNHALETIGIRWAEIKYDSDLQIEITNDKYTYLTS